MNHLYKSSDQLIRNHSNLNVNYSKKELMDLSNKLLDNISYYNENLRHITIRKNTNPTPTNNQSAEAEPEPKQLSLKKRRSTLKIKIPNTNIINLYNDQELEVKERSETILPKMKLSPVRDRFLPKIEEEYGKLQNNTEESKPKFNRNSIKNNSVKEVNKFAFEFHSRSNYKYKILN